MFVSKAFGFVTNLNQSFDK